VSDVFEERLERWLNMSDDERVAEVKRLLGDGVIDRETAELLLQREPILGIMMSAKDLRAGRETPYIPLKTGEKI